MPILIKKASEILTMSDGLGLVKDRSILIDNGFIKEIGPGVAVPSRADVIDARKCVVMPGLVDAHTHLVFAGSREDELALRIGGVKYEEIARQGGGIANTVIKTRAASEEELYQLARERIDHLVRAGTTTVEIKSGYGLSRVEELKILRVIRRLKDNAPIEIVPTFLVHAVPQHMKRRDYVDMVIEEILPAVAHQKIAEFCDVFCDKGAFPNGDTESARRRTFQHGGRRPGGAIRLRIRRPSGLHDQKRGPENEGCRSDARLAARHFALPAFKAPPEDPGLL
jgi:imidazolonepropionase